MNRARIFFGGRAARHIGQKCDYFMDKITSTETFIEYSATKSAL